MRFCSRKNLLILLAILVVGFIIVKLTNTSTVVLLPFLGLLACPLMCVFMAVFMGKDHSKTGHSRKNGKDNCCS